MDIWYNFLFEARQTLYKYNVHAQKKKINKQEKSVTWRHLVVILGRGAEERSGSPKSVTSLDTTVDGDADDSHESEETNNHARHASATEKQI